MTQNSQDGRYYATNLPGENLYDEARRATADLCRLARLWVAIALSNEEALNPVDVVVFDDEDGEELPVRRPPYPLNPNLRREDLKQAVREHWEPWHRAVQRATDAVAAVPDLELAAERVAANKSIMELKRIFFPYQGLHPSEQPGDQLIRPAGPLFCRAGGRSNIHAYPMADVLRPLEDFSDLLAVYAERSPSPEDDNGHPIPWIDRRTAAWFDKATGGGLYAAVLRVAQHRGAFKHAIQVGTPWHYSVDEVCFAYPQYAAKIRAAVAREAAEGVTGRNKA